MNELEIRSYVYDHLIFEITDTDHVYFVLEDNGRVLMKVWLGTVQTVQLETLKAIVRATHV